MKNFLKKSLAILICFGLISGAVACTNNGKKYNGELIEQTSAPDYTEEKTMWIGAWNNPPATEEAYRYMQECGINMVYVWANTPAALEGHLTLGEKYGVKIYPTMTSKKEAISVSEMNGNWLAKFADYPALGGFNYMDEPGQNAYEGLGELAANHETNYSSVDYYVNLYPISFYAQNSENIGITYDEYVQKYCEATISKLYNTRRLLSFDHYCMSLGTKGGYLGETWLNTVETIAKYGVEYGAETIAFFLTTKHYAYLAQTYESLRFQANVYMAYGIRGFSHFTYAGGFSDYPVDPGTGAPVGDGRLYYDMAQLNAELLSWDDIYLAFNWYETMQVTGTENLAEKPSYINPVFANSTEHVDKISFVDKITATRDAVVGAFEDTKGNKGLMVANFDFPTAVTDSSDEVSGAPDFSTLGTNTVELSVPDANTAMIIRNGEMEITEVENGMITVELNASEGAFIIPLRIKE